MLTAEEQRKQDETQAALAKSQSFTDGRRRVVPVKDQTISIGHGMLTFKANEIIDDVYRIAQMDQYDVEYIDLNVNDRSKRPKADESKGEAVVRTDNVNALADALAVDRSVVRNALFGKQPDIDRAAAIIHARGEETKLHRATDAAKLAKISEAFDTYRGMVAARATLFITQLAGEDHVAPFVDGLTGDPKIDLAQFAGDVRTAIGAAPDDDLGAPPAPPAEGSDGKAAAAAADDNDDEFKPGTPSV